MTCDCPICKGRDLNNDGIKIADKEVIPFVKQIFNRDLNRPLPLIHEGLLASLLAYSQAIAHDRIHKEPTKKYYTENRWMLKIKDKLNIQFQEVVICDAKELTTELVREVCEFNIEKD